MHKTIFRQLLDLVPKRSLRTIVEKYDRVKSQQKLSAWEQFISMSFAQLTNCSGLREIEAGFESMAHKSYQLGIRTAISKSSLSRANNKRPSIIFQKLTYCLIEQAKEYYKKESFAEELGAIVYALDSTYISLCLSLCHWGQIGKQNIAGIKLHALLNVSSSIPSFIRVTKGIVADNLVLDWITIEPGAFYVMDKAYVDFKRLNKIDEQKGFFIVRFKKNIKFKRAYSNSCDQSNGVVTDQVGYLAGCVGMKNYCNKIRKITFHDYEKNKTLIFMTNNFLVDPRTIALLYKDRWKIEIFFKWIKQNLRIQKFYGTSLNAVETQIWIAVATYLLVAIAKKRLGLQRPIHQILHILSFSIMETNKLFQIVNKAPMQVNEPRPSNQLNLFN